MRPKWNKETEDFKKSEDDKAMRQLNLDCLNGGCSEDTYNDFIDKLHQKYLGTGVQNGAFCAYIRGGRGSLTR